MHAPGHKRNRVIQIDVTNRCDLACSNCTRHLAHHPSRYDISPGVFRQACRILNRALPTFIVGMFGGNPCLHPQFAELCAIMREEIPEDRRRGLWTNHFRGKGQIVRDLLAPGYTNFNAHAVAGAVAEFEQWMPAKVIPESRVRNAWHSATLVAIKDFVGTPQVPDEDAMWRIIATCDIDRDWSGCVIELGGKPMLYSCEVHAAFDLMYGENNGVELTDASAVAQIGTFAHQYKRWCPSCGVALRLKGQQDKADTDDVSATHLPLVQLRVRRKHQLHEAQGLDAAARCEVATDYERRWTKEQA